MYYDLQHNQMIKSFSLRLFSLLTASVVAALCIHAADLAAEAPDGVAPLVENALQAYASGKIVAYATQPGAAASAAEVTAGEDQAQRFPGSHTVLLNQPVVILSSRGPRSTELPRGTAVRLLATRGEFLQISHRDEVVMIPRNAIMMGAIITH